MTKIKVTLLSGVEKIGLKDTDFITAKVELITRGALNLLNDSGVEFTVFPQGIACIEEIIEVEKPKKPKVDKEV